MSCTTQHTTFLRQGQHRQTDSVSDRREGEGVGFLQIEVEEEIGFDVSVQIY